MGKRLSNEVSETWVFTTLAIGDIIMVEGDNLRKFQPSEKKLTEMRESLRVNGQLQNLVVRPVNGLDAPYRLTAGFQRYKMLRELIEAGEMTDLVGVKVVDSDDIGSMTANFVENDERNDTSIVDKAYAIGRFRDGGTTRDEEGNETIVRAPMGVKEIAEQLHISAGYVSELDKIRHLREKIQKRIHTGEIIGKLARMLAVSDEAAQDEILAKLDADPNLSQTALYEALQDKKAGAKHAAGKGKKEKGKKAKGGGDGEGDGEGGDSGPAEKKPLSGKKAILILGDLTAKPAADVEETEPQKAARGVLGVFKKFMEGKTGEQTFAKNVAKAFVDYAG